MAAEYPTISHSQALPSITVIIYKVQCKVGMVACTCNPALRRGKQKGFERLSEFRIALAVDGDPQTPLPRERYASCGSAWVTGPTDELSLQYLPSITCLGL